MPRLVLVLCLLFGVSGCGSPSVRFNSVSQYAPIFSRPGWAALVRPEGVGEEFVKVSQGGGLFAQSQKVYWAGAIDAQAYARFKPCFAGGAVLMDESEAVEMERVIQAARAEGASPGNDPRAWREAIERARAASTILAGDEAANRAWENAMNPPAVVIRFSDAGLAFENRRPVFRAKAVATEPLTTRVFLDRTYRTQGRTVSPREDSGALSRSLQESVSDAVNGAMISLARDVNAALSE